MREAIKMMRAKSSGHIVNIGSMSAKVREADHDLYVATKAGIEGLAERDNHSGYSVPGKLDRGLS